METKAQKERTARILVDLYEIGIAYRGARERMHELIYLAADSGASARSISEVIDYSHETVRRIVRQHDSGGEPK